MVSIVHVLAVLILGFSLIVAPSSAVDRAYCWRTNVRCPSNVNPVVKRVPMESKIPLPVKYIRCRMTCRNLKTFYFELKPSECICLESCFNKYRIDTTVSNRILSATTEFQFDPNRLCASGFVKQKGVTCPQDKNKPRGRYNTSTDNSAINRGQCMRQCRKDKAYYYELSPKHCFCFDYCNDIKRGEPNTNEVGLLYGGFDPSLIDGERK